MANLALANLHIPCLHNNPPWPHIKVVTPHPAALVKAGPRLGPGIVCQRLQTWWSDSLSPPPFCCVAGLSTRLQTIGSAGTPPCRTQPSPSASPGCLLPGRPPACIIQLRCRARSGTLVQHTASTGEAQCQKEANESAVTCAHNGRVIPLLWAWLSLLAFKSRALPTPVV